MSKSIHPSENNARLDSFLEEIGDVVRKETRKSNRSGNFWNLIITLVIGQGMTWLVAWAINYKSAVNEEVPQSDSPSVEFNRGTPKRVQEPLSKAIMIDDLESALKDKRIKDYFKRIDTWIAEGAYLDLHRPCPIFPTIYFTSPEVREDFIRNLPGSAVFVNLDEGKDRFTDFTDEKSGPKWDTHGYSYQTGDETYYILNVFPNRAEISGVGAR